MGSKFTFGYLYNCIKRSLVHSTLDTRSVATASSVKEMVGFIFPEIESDILNDIETKFMSTEVNDNLYLMYIFTDKDIPVNCNITYGKPGIVRCTRYCGSEYVIVLRDAKINSFENVNGLSKYLFEELLLTCVHTDHMLYTNPIFRTEELASTCSNESITRRLPPIIMLMRLMVDVVANKSYDTTITVDDIVEAVQDKEDIASYEKYPDLFDFKKTYDVERLIIDTLSKGGNSVEFLLDNNAIYKIINTCIKDFSEQQKAIKAMSTKAAKAVKHEDIKSLSNETSEPIDKDPTKRKVSSGRIRKGKES